MILGAVAHSVPMYHSSGVGNDPNHLNDSSSVVKSKLKYKVRPKLNIAYYLAWIKGLSIFCRWAFPLCPGKISCSILEQEKRGGGKESNRSSGRSIQSCIITSSRGMRGRGGQKKPRRLTGICCHECRELIARGDEGVIVGPIPGTKHYQLYHGPFWMGQDRMQEGGGTRGRDFA